MSSSRDSIGADGTHLMTVDENVMGFVIPHRSHKESHWNGNVLMWVGGVEWCFTITGPTIYVLGKMISSCRVGRLKPISWAALDDQLWVDVTFECSKVGEQGWVVEKSETMPCVGVQRWQATSKFGRGEVPFEIRGTQGFQERGDHQLRAYVRVLRQCSLSASLFRRNPAPSSASESILTLSVDLINFYVKREWLMNLSPVFAAMLGSHFAESKDNVVRIDDVDLLLFNAFLFATYPESDDCVLPTPHTVKGLSELANRFDLPLLKKQCSRHLNFCSEIPIAERLALARRHHMPEAEAYLMAQLRREKEPSFCFIM